METSNIPKTFSKAQSPEKRDEFIIIERVFSYDETSLSIGLANIRAIVPDIEANKDKMARATETFREKGVNIAIFPEFCFSGYFWENTKECRRYMDTAVIENQTEWIDNNTLKPMLDENLRAVVFNNIRKDPGEKYFNSTEVRAKQDGVSSSNHPSVPFESDDPVWALQHSDVCGD
jgi:hypothetical protein